MRHTTTLLAEIPDLATTVFTTWDHPNPAPKAAHHTRAVPGSRPPTRIDVWDALRTDEKGELAILHGWCQLVDDKAAGGLAPIPEQTPTWAGVCRYLTETASWWEGQDMAGDCQREIRAVHGRLRALARIPAEPRYKCTHCGGRAHMRDNNSWLSCEDCGAVIDHRAEIAQAMARRPPMTVGQIADELGVKRDTIKKWIARRQVVPVQVRGRVRLFDIEEVQRLRVA